MNSVPRMAVIGLGAMGRHHARILSTMAEAELVAVADEDASALQSAALRHLNRYASFEDLLERERVDAVVVATPTRTHTRVAHAAVRRGINVLVEKPIAANLEEALALVGAAGRARVLLGVGHVERFNPAVQELKKRLDGGELGRLFQIQVRREGPFPPRIADVGVTEDLATHDLDVLGYLLGIAPEMVFAQVARRVHLEHEDLLAATLRYPGGILATLGVNWLTPTKIRQLAVNGERGLFVVDYLTQELTWYENVEASAGWDALDTIHGVSEGRAVRYPIRHREPLAVELEGFVEAMRGYGECTVTGEEGVRALTLALRLLESARTDMPILHPLETE